MPQIAENLARIEDQVGAACRAAGRPRAEVELMAVSKTHPVELLIEAAQAGHLLFGENRVQEFAAKSAQLASLGYSVDLAQPRSADHPHPPGTPPLRVYLIGHLQSNKTLRAAELFTGVTTLDSPRLAARLNESAATHQRLLPVLLEIKLSPEPSKEGLAPDSPELASLLERLPELQHLRLRGLMTVAPIDPRPDTARACFRQLRILRDKLAQHYPRLSFEQLSMGMSSDYSVAIAEGSTQVRIGTAIFGSRPSLHK